PCGDANPLTLDLGRLLLPVIEQTPVVGGIGAADPYRDVARLVDEYLAVGFSGLTNVPTAGLYGGDFRRHIDATNLGYPREGELIRLCRDRDVFSVAYAFSPDEAAAMAEAGGDVVGAHVGLTSGGLIGAQGTLAPRGAGEATLVRERAREVGRRALGRDNGGPREPAFAPDVPATEVARLGGEELATLRFEREGSDTRAYALAVMARGATALLRRLGGEGRC